MIPLSMAWIGDVGPYEHRQPTLARFLIGQILGLSTGVWLGGFAADHFSWPAALRCRRVAQSRRHHRPRDRRPPSDPRSGRRSRLREHRSSPCSEPSGPRLALLYAAAPPFLVGEPRHVLGPHAGQPLATGHYLLGCRRKIPSRLGAATRGDGLPRTSPNRLWPAFQSVTAWRSSSVVRPAKFHHSRTSSLNGSPPIRSMPPPWP